VNWPAGAIDGGGLRARRRRIAGAAGAARSGLTLLEVTLSITLTIGLMVAALAFYRHVVDVREDFSSQLGSVQTTSARRRVMDKITEELRTAIANPFLQMGLSGQAMEMRFITASLPSMAAWATPETTGEPAPPEQDLRMVGYRLRYVEDENGEEVVEGLARTEQRVITAQVAEEGEEIRSALVAPEFKFVSFAYWDNEGGEWLETWEENDLPLAVEISLGREPLPEDLEPIEYPYPTFRRTIYVPGGMRAFGGTTIIRGLGGGGRR